MNGRDGYAYTEKLDDPEALCRRALDNARVIGTADEHPMQGAQDYAAVTMPDNPVCDMSEREKIELAMEAERRALAADPARGTRVAQYSCHRAYHDPYYQYAWAGCAPQQQLFLLLYRPHSS